MNTRTKKLYDKGVSIWLDNITRAMLDDGTLKRYIDELSVKGLTSNPSIFEAAITKTSDYNQDIEKSGATSNTDEAVFFDLAIADIQRAADLFSGIYEKTNGLDGFVSLEVSPLLAYDAKATFESAKSLFEKVNRPNVFIKIPGTPEGLPAIEQSIAAGIPINVTLLFSPEQYKAAAMAYLRGVETRIEKGLNPDVRSVASVFVSRWDRAVTEDLPNDLQNTLGLNTMHHVYHSYQDFLASERVQLAMGRGAMPQRLLWASTGTKDPNISNSFYVEGLVAPYTINTMPEKTLLAFAEEGNAQSYFHQSNENLNDEVVEALSQKGITINALAEKLQKDGAAAFNVSWENLIQSISQKRKEIVVS